MATCGNGSLAQLNAESSKAGIEKASKFPRLLERQEPARSEEDTIMKRVELQRRMLEEYDKRDKARKVSDIQEVCPSVTEQEALKALEMCSNREGEAAARLVEPAFLRRVRAALGTSAPAGPGRARATSAGAKRAKPADPPGCPDGVFFGSFRGRGFPASANARPVSAEQPEEPVQASSELAALVAQSLADKQKQEAYITDPVSAEVHPGDTARGSGKERAKLGRGVVAAQRPGSAQSGHSAAENCKSAAENCQAAATESPIASSPQPYALMRELSDGTCRPCTTSEVAAMKGNEPPTRSPSVNPTRPLRTPVRPALSPLGRPSLATVPKPLEEAGNAPAPLQETEGQAKEATEASAPPAQWDVRGPNEATDPGQQSAQPCGNSDKENGSAKIGRCKGAAAKSGAAASGKAQQASSEDTVTISGLGSGENSETDDESAPARQRRNVQRPGSKGTGSRGRKQAVRATKPLSDILNSSAAQPEASKRPGSSAADSDPERAAQVGRIRAASGHRSAPPRRTASAISKSGHTRAGRVRQKSHKQAEMVSAGTLRAEPGWFNSGYIFPEGFTSRVNFRSSVVLDALCVHECSILGEEGQYWPAATFRVTSMDRAGEPLYAKSCTGCWSQVLKRINGEIEARRAAGEDLPPPPKTAIAGPEYFGLNQPEIMEAIEALDPERLCTDYWAGKHEREAAAAGLPVPSRAGAGRQAAAPRRRGGKRTRRGSSDSDSNEDEEVEEGAGNRWSALLRQARYKKRYEADADAGEYVDADNPLPDFTDPITLQPVVNPAISAHGHVMGLQTWKAVLADSGLCPLTKQPLRWEALTVLTHGNIERYRGLIRNID